VELVTRSEVRWFADRERHYPRTALRRWLFQLAYPAVGFGPPPLNRIVLHPDLFAALPESVRNKLTARVLRSGGSAWLRTLIDKSVRVTERATVEAVERRDGSLLVRLTDGSQREVDDVLIACGYRFNLERLTFMAPDVRARIAVSNGWPVLTSTSARATRTSTSSAMRPSTGSGRCHASSTAPTSPQRACARVSTANRLSRAESGLGAGPRARDGGGATSFEWTT